jgi:hypothetical protein
MSHAAIPKLSDFEAPSQFIDRWNRLFDAIRWNAFARFEQREALPGENLMTGWPRRATPCGRLTPS